MRRVTTFILVKRVIENTVRIPCAATEMAFLLAKSLNLDARASLTEPVTRFREPPFRQA